MDVSIYMFIAGKDLCNTLLEQSDRSSVVSSVLLVHLCCENIAEGWICSHCNNKDLFNDGNNKIRIDFEAKIKIARNLNLPKPVYNCFKTINGIRNRIAHQDPKMKRIEIPNKTIDSLLDNLKNLESQYETYRWKSQFFHSNPDELASKPNHDKLKLILAELFGFMMQLITVNYKDDFIKFMNHDNQPDLN
ncbi:hypothetical protein ID80_005119 [Salmonella enterica subsp. enterica serovar Ball]|nr:hypothetical protein [Salmonella enterica subsp. enterica serovar Ball]